MSGWQHPLDGEPLPVPVPGERRAFNVAHSDLLDFLREKDAEGWSRLVSCQTRTLYGVRRVFLTLEYQP